MPAARTLHPNDLFALRYMHDARLSPDGCRVAYVTSRTVESSGEERFEIAIEDLTSQERFELNFPGRATSPRWSPDGTHLAFIGGQGSGDRLYTTDANAGDVSALTSEDHHVRGPLNWSPDGSTIAYTVVAHRKAGAVGRITRRLFRSDGLGIIGDMRLSIGLFDIRRGTSRLIDVDRPVTMQPTFSPCGERLLFLASEAAAGYPPLSLKLFTVDLADGRIVEVLNERWYIAAAAWSPCGERIVIAGDYDSPLAVPMAGLWVVNSDGSNPQCRTGNLVGSLGLLVHHDMPTWGTSQNNFFIVPDAALAFATVTKGGCAEIWRIALSGPVNCEPAVSGLRTCVIMDANAKTSQLLYGVSDLSAPWDLFLSDLKGGEEQPLTRLNESVLVNWPVLKVEHLSFPSDDGFPLEGWYLARADRSGPQPTVMFIHGGPELVTGYAFRFDFHLLAANGYAVLFANFRGSSGYGEPFRIALQGDWGARGFPDHMAAVDAAIERGLADKSRLGVWGPSHGGFATCWIVGHTTRFRAAVAESAATNLSTLYYSTDLPDIFAREFGGRPDEVPDAYRSCSPLTYAGRCRTPTLMLHGEDDLRCPIAEAEQFYRLLHDAGCITELVRIPGMTHMGDSTGPLSARLAQNEALLDWFERNL